MEQHTWHAIWEAKFDSRGARIFIELATFLTKGDFCDKEPRARRDSRLSCGLGVIWSQGLEMTKSRWLDVAKSPGLDVTKSRVLEMCCGLEN